MKIGYPPFWSSASLRRKKIYAVLFVFVLAILATISGLLVPVSPEFAQLVTQQLNDTVTQGQAHGTLVQDIFVNNFSLCLLMFVPLFGFAIGMFILFNTGQAFRAVFEIQAANPTAAATPEISAATAFLALAMIGLVFLLEFASYSIGMAESIWVFRRIFQGERALKGELKYLLMFIGAVALMLIVGAVVETFTLTLGL
jgi:hypothetical protein